MPVPDTNQKSAAAASPSLQRGIALLEYLAKHSHGCTLSELSEELSVPQASLLRIGKALEEMGYLSRDVASKKILSDQSLPAVDSPQRPGSPAVGMRHWPHAGIT